MSLLVSSQLKEIDILSSRTNSSCSDASPSSQPVEPVEGENFNWIDSETDSEDNVVYTGRSTGYEKEGKEIPDMEEEIPDMEEEIQNVDEEEIGDIDEELRKMDEEDAIRNGS
jgi:hypothetical protein